MPGAQSQSSCSPPEHLFISHDLQPSKPRLLNIILTPQSKPWPRMRAGGSHHMPRRDGLPAWIPRVHLRWVYSSSSARASCLDETAVRVYWKRASSILYGIGQTALWYACHIRWWFAFRGSTDYPSSRRKLSIEPQGNLFLLFPPSPFPYPPVAEKFRITDDRSPPAAWTSLFSRKRQAPRKRGRFALFSALNYVTNGWTLATALARSMTAALLSARQACRARQWCLTPRLPFGGLGYCWIFMDRLMFWSWIDVARAKGFFS